MISQTPISVRINTCTLFKLDAEAATGWLKRNTIINRAVEEYIELQDLIRTCAVHEDNQELCRRELKSFLWRWSHRLHELV